MEKEKEYIKHEPGNKEAWVCICGTRPDISRFYPCDETGDVFDAIGGGCPDQQGRYPCVFCGAPIPRGSRSSTLCNSCLTSQHRRATAFQDLTGQDEEGDL